MTDCPCGSAKPYADCCEPVIRGERTAATAEELMRARYSAYAKAEVDFLRSSLHPDHRADFDEQSSRQWAEQSEWQGLEVIGSEAGGTEDMEGTVEFVALFSQKGVPQRHHERATFRKAEGSWYLVGGDSVGRKPVMRSAPKVGRNDPCPCGSGKKFKKCCGA